MYFVAVKTYFLAHELYVGVLFASFSISMIWSCDVRKVVFGSMRDRLFYSLGATLGSLLGLYTSVHIAEWLGRVF